MWRELLQTFNPIVYLEFTTDISEISMDPTFKYLPIYGDYLT